MQQKTYGEIVRPCLRCRRKFKSKDRRRNWICKKCTHSPDPFVPKIIRQMGAPDHKETQE